MWCARIHLAGAWRLGWKEAKLEARKLAQRVVQQVTGSSLTHVVVVGDGEKWVDLRDV